MKKTKNINKTSKMKVTLKIKMKMMILNFCLKVITYRCGKCEFALLISKIHGFRKAQILFPMSEITTHIHSLSSPLVLYGQHPHTSLLVLWYCMVTTHIFPPSSPLVLYGHHPLTSPL